MKGPYDSTVASALSDFTPAQLNAVAAIAEDATASAIDELRQDLLSWHCHLAMYVLAQICVALLAILLVQTVLEPGRPKLSAQFEN
ncbi:hypothetical protein SAMN05216360_11710 [Methylobacterium phyllostachyos]|uniref:Uncharacterized protein n=1 Tax=Methylobacterium phyllostachyos TaxID=582672 RepID=A0A1H0HUQ6_9HYPH|nr:hypothetical protein [Methylobacterium phyllostachyos]SDO22501.1 hypothetical protein SAMN05216360_11710 [Methylobacterium phyllostachyos]